MLYEIGYLDPSLIAKYVGAFLDLLGSRTNRMVWGGMIALATIAEHAPAEIWNRREEVLQATEKGTLITFVWGIKTLARVASKKKAYADRLVPKLKGFLKTCNPRDVPTHLESMLPAITTANRDAFVATARARTSEMASSHLARLRKAIKKVECI